MLYRAGAGQFYPTLPLPECSGRVRGCTSPALNPSCVSEAKSYIKYYRSTDTFLDCQAPTLKLVFLPNTTERLVRLCEEFRDVITCKIGKYNMLHFKIIYTDDVPMH
ncbi:hypothetical protein PR048_013446 [Dryococelus australis]|uniref:Uncharacterized protein n=1 Tax=Dryococelus australis TaxID=614101 RepID=A0ABQ9HSD1_9NEOP|nr:hypothetical protein PR048_013446 [Dryococelus australis]